MHRLALVVTALLLLATRPAEARKPEDVFGGRIMTSTTSYPSAGKSADAFIAQVKKQSTDRFQEDKENTRWNVYYAAFFKKPVNDLEVKVSLYDVTGSDKRFIESWTQYLTARGQRIVIGRIDVKRQEGKIDANSKVLIVMESEGRIIASATIFVIGEAKKRSGKAVFTDEDTKDKDEE